MVKATAVKRSLPASVLLLFILLIPGRSEAATRFALFIGNNVGDSSDGALRWAEEDARRIHRIFTKLGGVAPGRSVLLLGKDADRVRLELVRLKGQVEEANRHGYRSELLIFYSGHGDAEALHLGSSRLLLSDLRTQLDAVPAKVKVSVIDACRTGTIKRGRSKGASSGPSFDISLVRDTGPSGQVVITSAGANEVAQESDALRGSFFTHHMISALRGAADGNDDGHVSLAEFYRYTFYKTLSSSHRETAAVQHPEITLNLAGEGEFIMTVLKRASSTLVLPKGLGGNFLIVDDRNGRVFAEVEKPTTTQRVLALPKGRYRVQLRRSGQVLAAELSLEWGGRKVLSASMLEKQSLIVALQKGTALDPAPWEMSFGAVGGTPVVLGAGLAAGARLSLSRHSEVLPADILGAIQLTHVAANNDAWRYRHFNLRFGVGVVHHRFLGPTRLSFGATAGMTLIYERARRRDADRFDDMPGVATNSSELAIGPHVTPELAFRIPIRGDWSGAVGFGVTAAWLSGENSTSFQGVLGIDRQF